MQRRREGRERQRRQRDDGTRGKDILSPLDSAEGGEEEVAFQTVGPPGAAVPAGPPHLFIVPSLI